MSKYDALWAHVGKCESPTLKLTFAEIEGILAFRSTIPFAI